MKRILLSLMLVSAWAAGSLRADDEEPQYETGRAVARISVLNGDVSVRRGDSGDVIAAALNAPLMADDRLLTSSSARAEVQLDHGNIIRIGPNSEVRFAGLDIKGFQLQIAAGTVTYRVLRPSQAQAELDTPSVALRPRRQGIYRIDVREDGTSQITVRAGEAEIDSSNGSEMLEAGQTMNARGTAADPEFQIVQAVPPDNFDRWNEDRDRYLERSQSYQHVSPDVSGAEDLDQYGEWTNDPTYGSVWTPRVAEDWAPYRDGRWVWEDYYGWTWVSYDPWGWAPYHYGRWFHGGRGWAWWPGAAYGRHYWSPALVGFFGFGGGGGIGFGFGNVGWCPLAPFEVFHPWYGRGFYGGYRNGFFGGRTNIVNNVNIINTYRNAGFRGGITGVRAGDFGRHGQFMALNHDQIRGAGQVRGALPVSPDRASLRFSDRASSGNFRQHDNQNFAQRSQAPRVEHFSFDQQQRGMQQYSRSNSFNESGRNGAGNSPTSFGRTTNDGNNGWRRIGDRPADASRGNATPNTPSGDASRFNRGGNVPSGNTGRDAGRSEGHDWNRFGQPVQHDGGGAQQSQPASRDRGWQRFDSPRPDVQRQQDTQRQPDTPRQQNDFSRRSFSGGDNGGAVHINPPIVRERTPNNDSRQQRNYAPSNESPRSFGGQRNTEAPRNFEAPRGGGGGGGQRNFGGGAGGGGGQRNSGGGGGGGNRGGGGGGERGGGGGHGRR